MSETDPNRPSDGAVGPSERRVTPRVARAGTASAVVCGAVVSAGMALAGGLLIAAGSHTAGYGMTMFLALPVACGFVTSCFVRPLRAILLTTVLAVLLCFIVLLFTGLEGVLCIIMAAPLIITGAVLGSLVGWLVRKEFDSRANFIIFPLLGATGVFAGAQAEVRLERGARIETVESAITLDAAPQQVWDATVQVKEVSAAKPLLMWIGLPMPRSCTLEGSGVGARRTCYFETGRLDERVTRWDPPHHLDLQIVRVTLPGRHWLGYRGASYAFEPLGPKRTRLVRRTTISSELGPAWYWRPLERLGVESEHEYLFAHLRHAVGGE